MLLTRRISGFLIAFGVWSWIIWPTFLKNIWHDPRSWQHGPTGFFLVHALLTGASLLLGTLIGILGVRGWRAAGRLRSGRSGELSRPAGPESSRTSG